MTESYGQKLAKDMIDGVIKQASNINLKSDNPEEDVAIDPETKKKLIERELKMAADPNFEMEQLAIEKANKRMRDILSGRGGTTMEGQGRLTEEEQEQKAAEELNVKLARLEQAKAIYIACIDAGGTPATCAQMVAGIIPTPQAPTATAPPATSITELVSALKALDDLRGSDKGLTELKASFDNLAQAVKQGNTSQPLDPISFAKQQAEAVVAWQKALQELTPPSVTSTTGEPLENVRERNRHEERMKEVESESDYKKKLGETVAEIPERIGRGLGGQILEGRGEDSGGGGGGGLESIACECGQKIYITPETGPQVVCPKCDSIFTRKGETKAEWS